MKFKDSNIGQPVIFVENPEMIGYIIGLSRRYYDKEYFVEVDIGDTHPKIVKFEEIEPVRLKEFYEKL